MTVITPCWGCGDVVKRHGGAATGRSGASPPAGLADLVQPGHRALLGASRKREHLGLGLLERGVHRCGASDPKHRPPELTAEERRRPRILARQTAQRIRDSGSASSRPSVTIYHAGRSAVTARSRVCRRRRGRRPRGHAPHHRHRRAAPLPGPWDHCLVCWAGSPSSSPPPKLAVLGLRLPRPLRQTPLLAGGEALLEDRRTGSAPTGIGESLAVGPLGTVIKPDRCGARPAGRRPRHRGGAPGPAHRAGAANRRY